MTGQKSLDLEYADKVVSNIKNLWDGDVTLFTIIEDDVWEI